MLTTDQNARLDDWVTAKRNHDYHAADKIRVALLHEGIEPEVERPRKAGVFAVDSAGLNGPGDSLEWKKHYTDSQMLELKEYVKKNFSLPPNMTSD